MAQLTFPIVPDGLIVDALVNLEASSLVPLRLSGQPSPSPIPVRALIDTGSDITGVALPILQQLGTPPVVQTSTQGIGGPLPVRLHHISFHILDL